MSRKYLNEKWCVRCGRKTATPYLRKNETILRCNRENPICLDVGCGNGRNSVWAENIGYKVTGIDMAGCELHNNSWVTELGHDKFPVEDRSVDLVLANFVFMFLNPEERCQVCEEIERVARTGCVLVVELYAAKDSFAKTVGESVIMQANLYNWFLRNGWQKLRYSKERFIIMRV